MSSLTNALMVVLAINAMLFLGQASVNAISDDAPEFYNCQGSALGSFEQGNCTTDKYVLDSTDPANRLPSGASSVDPDTGNLYTDSFTTGKSWFLDTLGLNYLVSILSAPMNFLSALGLPQAFSFAIGALWYGVTLFLIVAFLLGRDA